MTRSNDRTFSTIFEDDDGKPRQFYILPCELKAQLRTLIEAGGGTLSSKYFPGAIKLIEPRACSSERTYKDYISTNFIFECVRQGEFLNPDDYRIENERTQEGSSDVFVSRVSSTITTSSLLSGRQPYSPAEDLALIDFVKENCSKNLPIGGNALWKAAERQQITLHSWQSMKDRYRKHLKPKKSAKHFKEVIHVFEEKAFETKFAIKDKKTNSSKAYGPLDLKAPDMNQEESNLAKDSDVKPFVDIDEKPSKKLRKLLSRTQNELNFPEKHSSTKDFKYQDDEEEISEAMTVDGGNEPDSPDSFDKRLMSFASSKTSELPKSLSTIREPSSNDKFSVKNDSCSSLNGNNHDVETHQDNLNSCVTELPRDITVEKTSTLMDYKGKATLRQKVSKKVIEELQSKGKNDSEPVTATSARYSPQKHRISDSCGVMFTPNNSSTPYKRKRSAEVVKSPSLLSAVETNDNRIPQLRRSPRKNLMQGSTDSSSQQRRESGKQSEVSGNSPLEHVSSREATRNGNNGGNGVEDKEADCEDTALMMATAFKELLTMHNDASLEEILNILFMSCGSVSSARNYLQTGTIPSDLWTWEEDQILLTQDIRKVMTNKGRKAVCERVEFLGNGSLR